MPYNYVIWAIILKIHMGYVTRKSRIKQKFQEVYAGKSQCCNTVLFFFSQNIRPRVEFPPRRYNVLLHSNYSIRFKLFTTVLIYAIFFKKWLIQFVWAMSINIHSWGTVAIWSYTVWMGLKGYNIAHTKTCTLIARKKIAHGLNHMG